MPATKASQLGTRKLPGDRNDATLRISGHAVKLTNLDKVFWPDSGLTKRDLLQYYADMHKVLVPHLSDRAMVMKRYPNGITGKHFFMKRTPDNAPKWLATCSIKHKSAGMVKFPVINDIASLLWVVNLGCIDLNPWYARCDDTDRPDYLHFDLDPVKGKPAVPFSRVRQVALILRDTLGELEMDSYPKSTGSRGIHVYVPIERGPTQKQVWSVAKRLAVGLAKHHGKLITAEYRIAKRPAGRVLVDYNQNAWGRTLASVYSVRPRPKAPVAAPVTWDEVEEGFEIEDFRLDNMPKRVAQRGDLFRPMLLKRGRVKLERYLQDEDAE